MAEASTTCLVISDFNPSNLLAYLERDLAEPQVTSSSAPYGQVMQTLLDPDHVCWNETPDCTIVWTQPAVAIPTYTDAMRLAAPSRERIRAEVERFSDALIAASRRTRLLLVPAWVVAPAYRGWGVLDMSSTFGTARLLADMNNWLAASLDSVENAHVLNAQRWVSLTGRRAFDPKLWYLAKIPFGNQLLQGSVRDFKAAIAGTTGRAKKLVVIDLDDTIWGGAVGEVGCEGLSLGGHDARGEAYVDLQQALKALTHRGVVLAIISKNEESVALDAIRRHPEMVLSVDDLIGWRINWQDKVDNLLELTDELNLGLDSVVFIDNSSAERSRVRGALPDVLVPEWPDDPLLYPTALEELTCFDTGHRSAEDAARAQSYATERQRQQSRVPAQSLDDWLEHLQLKVEIHPMRGDELPRAAQLLNKTNQMNLSTRRLTEVELAAWADGNAQRLWTVHVADIYGSSGLTGITSMAVDGDQGQLVDFILSCRVFGRHVEECMLFGVLEEARTLGLVEVVADYLPTERNTPCLRFFDRSGFRRDGHRFAWSLTADYPKPEAVTVVATS